MIKENESDMLKISQHSDFDELVHKDGRIERSFFFHDFSDSH